MSQSQRERAKVRLRAKRRRRNVITGGVVGVGVLIVALVGLALVSSNDTGSGTTDPEAWDLPGFGPNEGERITLASLRGKPVVLNFFASWCDACDFELPGFRRVSQELRDDVTFVGIASLETGNPLTMPERHGVTWWRLARDVGGRDGSGLHDKLGGRGMPITAFYDADGALVDFVGGALDEANLRQRLNTLYGLDLAPN